MIPLNIINLLNLSINPFRDLKPENLLLTSEDDDANIKIADFGFAVECSDSSLTTRCGTPGKIFPPFPYHNSYPLSTCFMLLNLHSLALPAALFNFVCVSDLPFNTDHNYLYYNQFDIFSFSIIFNTYMKKNRM